MFNAKLFLALALASYPGPTRDNDANSAITRKVGVPKQSNTIQMKPILVIWHNMLSPSEMEAFFDIEKMSLAPARSTLDYFR